MSGRDATAGEMRQGVHVLPLRVYYEDTDAGGIVYHANYLRFAERARTEFLRTLGVDQREMMNEEGLAFAVVRAEIDYVQPARLDDRLEVCTTIKEIRAAVIDAYQVVRRENQDLARITVRVACVRTNGRPARLPVRIREACSALLAAGTSE